MKVTYLFLLQETNYFTFYTVSADPYGFSCHLNREVFIRLQLSEHKKSITFKQQQKITPQE